MNTSYFGQSANFYKLLLKSNTEIAKLDIDSGSNALSYNGKQIGYCDNNPVISKFGPSQTVQSLNYGGTTLGGDSKGHERIKRHFYNNPRDVYLACDIHSSDQVHGELADQNKSQVFIPSLFKKEIKDSSGMLIAPGTCIEEVYNLLPNIGPQGRKAKEKNLDNLNHPGVLIKALYEEGPVWYLVVYISYYTTQKQRLDYIDKLLKLITSVVPKNEPVILGGDFNLFGWTIPGLPKALDTFKFLPIAATHAATGLFRKNSPNLLGREEFEMVTDLAQSSGFGITPKNYSGAAYSPSISKGAGKFGASFGVDAHLYRKCTILDTSLQEGVYKEDHKAVVSKIRL